MSLRSSLGPVLVGSVLLLLGSLRPVFAAPPPEAEILQAEEEQTRAIREAERAGSTTRVVATYESKYGRQPTVLNRYLYARALFFGKNPVASHREFEGLLASEPAFWRAHVRLAYLDEQAKNHALARQHIEAARSSAPDDPLLLQVSVEVGAASKDWVLVLDALRRLLIQHPDDMRLVRALAQAAAEKGDWAACYEACRTLEAKAPPAERLAHLKARAAWKLGKTKEAVAAYEALIKEDPQGAPLYLQALQEIHSQAQDWQAVAGVLERMRPFVKAELREKLEQHIRALRAGQVPGAPGAPGTPGGPTQPKEPTAEEQTLALFERCLSPNVDVRRAALQDFLTAALDYIPRAILVRYHPQEEPDPECRAWVVRIVGRGGNAQTAKVPGHALQDPDARVRRVAAEALGEIGTPAGVLYLSALISEMPLAADAPAPVVDEYNAARLALVTLTGFDDIEIGAQRWVPAAGLETSRKRWEAWFDSAPGLTLLRKAIDDLMRTGEPNPEWYLVILIYHRSSEVAQAAYDALLQRSTQPSSDPVAQRMWPSFPHLRSKVDGKDLTTAQSFEDLKAQVLTWWKAWRAAREADLQPPGKPN